MMRTIERTKKNMGALVACGAVAMAGVVLGPEQYNQDALKGLMSGLAFMGAIWIYFDKLLHNKVNHDEE